MLTDKAMSSGIADCEAVECVFHEDRYVFDAFVRDLRKAHVVTRSQAKVMAMTVCTCKKKVAYRQPISEDQVRAAADHLLTLPLPFFDQLSRSASNLVTSSACIAQHLPLTSQARLTVLLHQIVQGDRCTLLEEEAAQAARSRGEDYWKAKLKRRPQSKPKPDIVKKIIARKKRNYPVRITLDLPLFGGSSSKLFHNPGVGPNFSALRRQCACVLEIDSEKTAANMAANVQVTVVKAWCSTPQTGRDAQELLTVVATQIQQEHNKLWGQKVAKREQMIALEEQRKENVRRVERIVFQGGLRLSQSEDDKLFRSRDFEKKVLKEKRNDGRSSNTKRPPQREDGSSFTEGHCLHCLLPFKHFMAASNTDVIKKCRHHPGYVTGKKWTCCGTGSNSQHPTHEEHAQNGCAEKRHSFRPHKKAARGVGAKAYLHQRSYRQRRISLAPHTYTAIY